VESHSTEVLVYCRSSYYTDQPALWRGIRLVYLPVPRGAKGLESLVHSFLSSLHVLREKVDVIYFLDPANAPFCALLRCFGKRVAIHTDGLGWKRRKWGPLARGYYKIVKWACARCASALVTDNPAMQKYYRDEYGAETLLISYGATNRHGVDTQIYADLDLTLKQYLLIVARLEPENNPDLLPYINVRKLFNLGLNVLELRFKIPSPFSLPPLLKIEPTPQCQLRCTGCWHKDVEFKRQFTSKDTLTLEDFRKILDPIAKTTLGISISFRGEPLLNKHLPALIRYAHDKRIATTLPTNLAMPMSADFARQSVNSGLDTLYISLDGASEETYRLYRVGGDSIEF
jgi:Glycosyl transferase 4-like domain/Radical SAM superfamily